MSPTTMKIAGSVGAAGAVAGGTAYGLSGGNEPTEKTPEVKFSRFLSEEDEGRVREVLEKLGGSCPENFKNVDGKCEIPDKLAGAISIGTKKETSKSKESDCLNRDFYWSRSGYSNSNGSCNTMNMTLRPVFRREIKDWESRTERINANGGSMKTLDDEGFWGIKSEDNVYALLVKEEKMNEIKKDWDFPQHFEKASGGGVSIWDICHKLKSAAGGNGEGKELYIHNPKGNTWWDCKNEGFMYQVKDKPEV